MRVNNTVSKDTGIAMNHHTYMQECMICALATLDGLKDCNSFVPLKVSFKLYFGWHCDMG